MSYSIDIAKAISEVGEQTQLEITLSDPVGFDDAKLFLFEVQPKTDDTQEAVARFWGVCSPGDLADYMPDAPPSDAAPAFFRRDSVSLLFDRVTLRDQVYDEIRAELLKLISVMAGLDAVSSPTTETLSDE